MTEAWLTPAEILELRSAHLPGHEKSLQRHIRREGWRDGEFARRKGGRGWEYAVRLLPMDAQMRHLAATAIEHEPDAKAKRREVDAALWEAFDRLTDTKKSEAYRRLSILNEALALWAGGASKTTAFETIATRHSISVATLYNWQKLTQRLERDDWVTALAPRQCGGGRKVAIDPRAWEALKADYLRAEEPSFRSCYNRLVKMAEAHGWGALPPSKTLQRRVKAELPRTVVVLARKGNDAARALFPAQTRTRAHLHAMQMVNVDGHKFDVFVRWEDGTIGRPMMVALQDLYSGKMLAWRLDRSENKECVRLTIGDMVRDHGIPEHIYLDNGRAFASKWITGGTKTRFRFKVKDEEPAGLLTSLGVQCHWTTPYSGQSKPIERAFRDLADTISRHPLCAGAFTGNHVDAKPENYGSKAIDIDEFRALVDVEMRHHNARPGRRSEVAAGRSFDEAFEASLAKSTTLVRRASPAQSRLWLLAAEAVRARKPNGELHLLNNRYWSPHLAEHAGSLLTVRFDPQSLHGSVHVYGQDGQYIAEVECIAATGFDDVDAARQHNTDRKSYIKGIRQSLEAERRLSLRDLVELTPAPEPDQKTDDAASASRPVRLAVNGPEVPFENGGTSQGWQTQHDDAFGNVIQMIRTEASDPLAPSSGASVPSTAGNVSSDQTKKKARHKPRP